MGVLGFGAMIGAPRHRLFVRITHWVSVFSTVALIVSGIAILLAHPRLYWGETGAVGAPALIELPIPFILGESGWGRYLHFLAAWAAVFAGVAYLALGLVTGHFRKHLLPSPADLAASRVSETLSDHLHVKRARLKAATSYNVLQRLAYCAVVFILGPVILLSGLAFSPAIASVVPGLVSAFAGQQSARTIHFFAGAALVLFIVVHIAMVVLAGFGARMREMIIGAPARRTEFP